MPAIMSVRSISFKILTFLAALAVTALAVTASAVAYSEDEIIGSLPEKLYATTGETLEEMRNSSVISSQLGEATADAAVLLSGADFGYLCGGDMWGNLVPGELTWGQLCAAYTEDRELATARVTPAELKQLLEIPAAQLVLDPEDFLLDVESSAHDAFPQLSGLKLQIDLSAPSGERVRKLETTEGLVLDLEDDETEYLLVGTDYMFSGGYGMPVIEHEALGVTMAEAMAEYIVTGFNESYNSFTRSSRVVLQGGNENTIWSKIPTGMIYAVIALILICQFYRKKQPRDPNDRTVDY